MKKLIFSTSCEAHDIQDEIEAIFATKDKMLEKPVTFEEIWK